MSRCGIFTGMILLALVSCKKARSVLPVDAAPPPSFASTGPAQDAGIEFDELWKRALLGDRIDWAALADREGARGLLQGVEVGGEVGTASLGALQYAEDAEIALGRLGEIAIQTDGEDQRKVVESIGRIAAQPLRQAEVLDASGAKACADALMEIARKTSVKRENRVIAISALRALAQRFVVDASAIPTDLDSN